MERKREGDWEPEADDGPWKTAERAGRDFDREAVGMVRRRAAGLEEGVDGRVGGTLNSRYLNVFARDAAVGSSYPALDVPAEAEPEPDAWLLLVSIKDDKDALRVSFRAVVGGVGGFKPECDF